MHKRCKERWTHHFRKPKKIKLQVHTEWRFTNTKEVNSMCHFSKQEHLQKTTIGMGINLIWIKQEQLTIQSQFTRMSVRNPVQMPSHPKIVLATTFIPVRMLKLMNNSLERLPTSLITQIELKVASRQSQLAKLSSCHKQTFISNLNLIKARFQVDFLLLSEQVR